MLPPVLDLPALVKALNLHRKRADVATLALVEGLQDQGVAVEEIVWPACERRFYTHSQESYSSDTQYAVAVKSGEALYFLSGARSWTEELHRIHAKLRGKEACESMISYVGEPKTEFITGEVHREWNRAKRSAYNEIREQVKNAAPKGARVALPSLQEWRPNSPAHEGGPHTHPLLQVAVAAFHANPSSLKRHTNSLAWKLRDLLETTGHTVRFLSRPVQGDASHAQVIARQLVLEYGEPAILLELTHSSHLPIALSQAEGEQENQVHWRRGPLEEVEVPKPTWDHTTGNSWQAFRDALGACALHFHTPAGSPTRPGPRL